MKGIALALLLLSGCAFRNDNGACIGIFEKEKAGVEYRIDAWNTAWSIIGFELIFPPVLWVTSCAKCPESGVGK